MRIQSLLLGLVFSVLSIGVWGQADPVNVQQLLNQLESMPTDSAQECASDQLMMRNPFLLEAFESRRALNDCDTDVDLTTAEVLTIPVVFHVMHTGQPYGEEANIIDDQLISAIDNLNDRFAATPGALGVDEQSIDSKIQFCLASRNPEGEATDGITRHNLSSYQEYVEDGVTTNSFASGLSDLSMKNIACWDPDLYCNVYIVTEIQGNNAGGGIQGYAYLGPTNNCLDGIVLLYNVVGTEGTLKSGRDMNTTFPHEMGHYLSLYHTFNNAPSSCDYVESNCCTAGDRVCDTPVQTSSASGCNSVCDSNPANYMDYTSQTCKTMFTEGQIERMRDAAIFVRGDLISADNLACYPVGGMDVGITQLEMPEEWCQDSFSATLKINNFGSETATGVTVSINGGFEYPISPIDAGSFIIYTISNIQIENGPDFEFLIEWDGDENPENNSAVGTCVLNEDLRWVEITVTPDVWSNELDWELLSEFGNVILFDGDWPVFDQEPKTKAACLPIGCYEFVITDIAGDGMSNPFSTEGSYTITVDGVTVVDYVNPSCFPGEDCPESEWSERVEEFCVTNCPAIECPGDLDGNGTVDIGDLLQFLTMVGMEGECLPADLDFSGTIGVGDVIELMNLMGESCFDNPEQVINEYVKILQEELDIIDIRYFNSMGIPVVWDADLPSGIYIVVETLEDGTTRSRKIYQFR